MTKSLFDAFRDAMLANPIGSRKEAMDRFVETMKSDPEYLDKLAIDYFERMAASWAVAGDEHDHSFTRTKVSKDKGGRISEALTGKPKRKLVPRRSLLSERASSRKRSEDALNEMRKRIPTVTLLDLAMPDGKLLRDSNGADCRKAGGFYAEIAKHIKPTQVVDRHLSEGDLQNIRARFYQANKEHV